MNTRSATERKRGVAGFKIEMWPDAAARLHFTRRQNSPMQSFLYSNWPSYIFVSCPSKMAR